MTVDYEAVIGLEVHAQLLTRTKLFCACSTSFGEAPNTNVCPVCLGLPGALPVVNRRAVEYAVRAALAVGCQVHESSVFARKHYFYPDLPKGYQISQYDRPLATRGALELEVEGRSLRAGITRIHMEEDAGKNVHGVGGDSLVDLNRAGTPLIEIVGEPDLRAPAEAAAYLRALRDVLTFIGVNDGNLEEGSFRCDANVSIRPRGQAGFGTRVELKNLNSFRFVERALEAEIARQTVLLDAGRPVEQETRSFEPESMTTHRLRSKEEAHDYRYFPDPDLPPLRLDAALVEAQRAEVGELPAAARARLASRGLSAQAVATLTAHPATLRYFDEAARLVPEPVRVANFMLTELLRGARFHGLEASFPITPAQLAELVALVADGEISGKQAKEVYAAIQHGSLAPRAVVRARGLRVIGDADALEALCRRLLEAEPALVASVRGGKRGVLGHFVGKVMKETGGSADPKLVSELLTRLIESEPEA
ncbi:MAG: Asp-tRNA(Asn)/Glu-tRNA(Gln) amidotransferase subunit GatB [Sorangiineae bacterium]|nr:Asp-tRNA(Asn)/Glu-tRNA(Gln) amidotransferase subunit GatB [Polyangiaceae bacterium]MEB2322109.1 Asp-tRNA(Asn)/Glu-tRNA(Gln) amidotransferase subunit GatB [Sorangiineae bacterium]